VNDTVRSNCTSWPCFSLPEGCAVDSSTRASGALASAAILCLARDDDDRQRRCQALGSGSEQAATCGDSVCTQRVWRLENERSGGSRNERERTRFWQTRCRGGSSEVDRKAGSCRHELSCVLQPAGSSASSEATARMTAGTPFGGQADRRQQHHHYNKALVLCDKAAGDDMLHRRKPRDLPKYDDVNKSERHVHRSDTLAAR